MAESNSSNINDSANDNWFGSWLTAAKNKSCEVLEFVKKDLEEFGSVVKNEATNVVSTTGNALEKTLKLDEPESTVNTMKRSISSFLGQMNEVLNPSPDDSDTEAIMVVDGQETVPLTKLQQAIYELQKSESTFTDDPDESSVKQYQSWLEIIDDELSEERLSRHLLKSQMLKDQYTSLVPLKVEHGAFWKRYLFKKALLEDDIARQEAMQKREAKEKEATIENVKWEEGTNINDVAEEFAKDIELSEEEQIRLLEQYEHETKARKSSTTSSPSDKETIDSKKEIKIKKVSPSTKMQVSKVSNKSSKPVAKTNKISTKSPPKTPKNKPLSEELENAMEKKPASSSSSSTDGDWEKISD
ncbi:BSD domain-containing protein 1-B-like isoform X1 [Atheta coriaria]|uniref:BSD domain-containing protein 1-B-like isoform X1 n=1 Tax=Dalotia coriaria TaxID=877792 RepID=UPI0031F37E8D